MTTSPTPHQLDPDEREQLTEQLLRDLNHWGVKPYNHYHLVTLDHVENVVHYWRSLDEKATRWDKIGGQAWRRHYRAEQWTVAHDGSLLSLQVVGTIFSEWSMTADEAQQAAIAEAWTHYDQRSAA